MHGKFANKLVIRHSFCEVTN